MLEIVLSRHVVAGGLGVAGELLILFRNVVGCPRTFTSGPFDSYTRVKRV